MKKTCIFIIAIVLLFSACKNGKTGYASDNVKKFANDSLFLETQNLPEQIKDFALKGIYARTKIIEEKLVVHIIDIIDGNCYCLFKEYTNSGINRFYYVFNDRTVYAFIPEYNTKMTDMKILAKYKNDTSDISSDDNTNIFSDDFWNIPELRLPYYKEKNKQLDDIKKLEDLVNKLELFNNFSFETNFQNKILKDLLLTTQIVFPMWDNQVSVFFESTYPAYYEEYGYIRSINPDNAKKTFDKVSAKNRVDIGYIWINKNVEYVNKIDFNFETKNENEKIYYYYTDYDLRIFKFAVNLKKNKIELEKEYLNKQFIYFGLYWFFPCYCPEEDLKKQP